MKVHLLDRSRTNDHEVVRSLCKQVVWKDETTTNTGKVTCKNCLKRLTK